MVTVRRAHPEHFEWIAKRAQLSINGDFRALEAIDSAGRIVGMVGFDGWTRSACMMHVALEYPAAARHLIYRAFGLAFDAEDSDPPGCARKLVNAVVLSTNARSLALVKHLGFRETHRIRDGWDEGVSIVLHEMRREECRYLRRPVRKAA